MRLRLMGRALLLLSIVAPLFPPGASGLLAGLDDRRRGGIGARDPAVSAPGAELKRCASATDVRETDAADVAVGEADPSVLSSSGCRDPTPSALARLLDGMGSHGPVAATDREAVSRAFFLSEKSHGYGGAAAFARAVAVAGIVAAMRLDVPSVVAALLFGVVESADEPETALGSIKEEFGAEAAGLANGVVQIGRIPFASQQERRGAENYRRMILAVASDVRAVLVKLADRALAVRTLEGADEELRRRAATEALDLYAPLAHRLGMYRLKTELEDAGFRFLQPEEYGTLEKMMAKRQNRRLAYTAEVVALLEFEMGAAGLAGAVVTGRAKHLYSVYRKMRAKGVAFDDIQDLMAFRIIVHDVGQCYQALGVVHGLWAPVSGRFKDYIALPKPNGYQSLHTTVMGPKGRNIEVQIRTVEMHRIAEDGMASHWMYKSGGRMRVGEEEARRFEWLRQLVEWAQSPNDHTNGEVSPRQAAEHGLFEKEVFVFSPKGQLFALAKGATVLDFAYRIHSELGNRCTGALVNGRMVPLKHAVENGDTVEVLTSATQTPRHDWLDIVRTSKARERVRQWIKAQRRRESVAAGRDLLERELKRHASRNHAAAVSMGTKAYRARLKKALTVLKFSDEEDLLAALGGGRISPGGVVGAFFGTPPRKRGQSRAKKGRIQGLSRREEQDARVLDILGGEASAASHPGGGDGIVVGGERNMLVGFCRHCSPLRGEEIRGVITRGRGIKVHRLGCEYLEECDEERRLDARWDAEASAGSRPVHIQVVCEDTPGMLAGMSRAITSSGVNIRGVVLRRGANGRGRARFEVMLSSADELERVTRQLRAEEGVISVARG